jgi:hypothetical protein
VVSRFRAGSNKAQKGTAGFIPDTQGYSRFHSRHKGVQQAPFQIHKDTAGSTLGTKGYIRLHIRYSGIQQFSVLAQGGSAGSMPET